MIYKWRRVMKEGRKVKDYLICYSSDLKNSKMLTHEEALDRAKDAMINENCIRIIIDRGEI